MPDDAAGRRTRISRPIYVAARGRGLTQQEALALAGGRCASPTAASRTAARIEDEPGVRQAIADARAEAEEAVREDLSAAWQAGARWLRSVVEGAVDATSRDKLEALGLIGRARGDFLQRVELTGDSHRIEFKGLARELQTKDDLESASVVSGERLDPDRLGESRHDAASLPAGGGLPPPTRESLESLADRVPARP